MGGSASKDITFSDLESSVNNKNNDSKKKIPKKIRLIHRKTQVVKMLQKI